MNAMVKGLLDAGHSVKILSVNTSKYNVKPEDIPEDYRRKTGIELVYVDLSVKILPALTHLVRNKSYHISRFVSGAFEEALTRILENERFDIIQFETLFTTPYIPLIRKMSEARLVLRAHNIEHMIWRRVASGCRNPLKKFYLNHLANTLEKYEISVLKQLDGLVAITWKDADYFKEIMPKLPVIDIPFGIDVPDNNLPDSLPANTGQGFFHLGSMNWMPNQEGIKWFLEKVWPLVHKKHPGLTFSLAGRAMPQWLKVMKMPGVIIDGEVPDAREYMNQHDVMIVPLFSGSGIRIKIIEGMLAGKAIITTPVGAEGINYTDGQNLMIARDVAEFEKAIEYLNENSAAKLRIGADARRLVTQEHNNAVLMEKLVRFYNSLG
jgi:glycosyltransferase involved in cell wall biosynthesis